MLYRSFLKALYALGIIEDMAMPKQSRHKRASSTTSCPRRSRSPRLQDEELRRALEELRDTKSETRAQELKKAISDSICGA
jgi:hypothetical protein